MGYDQSSLAWCIWFSQEEKGVKSVQVPLERKEETVKMVGEIGTGGRNEDMTDSTGNEDDSMKETKSEHDMQERPNKRREKSDGFTAKRMQFENELRRSSHLAHRQRRDYLQMDTENFLAATLQDVSKRERALSSTLGYCSRSNILCRSIRQYCHRW